MPHKRRYAAQLPPCRDERGGTESRRRTASPQVAFSSPYVTASDGVVRAIAPGVRMTCASNILGSVSSGSARVVVSLDGVALRVRPRVRFVAP